MFQKQHSMNVYVHFYIRADANIFGTIKLNSKRFTPFVTWRINIICLYLAFDQSATGLDQVIDNNNMPTTRVSLLNTNYPLISLPNFCTNYLYMHCEGGYGAICVNKQCMQNRWKHHCKIASYICIHKKLLHKDWHNVTFTRVTLYNTVGKCCSCLWNRFQAPSSGKAIDIWKRRK